MPLLPICIAFIIGVILASYISFPAFYWLIASVAFLLLSSFFHFLSRYKSRISSLQSPSLLFSSTPLRLLAPSPFHLYLLLTALTLGAARYQSTRPILTNPNFIAHYNDTNLNVIITGLLIQPPDERDSYTNLRIQTETIRLENGLDSIPVTGLLLARTNPGTDFEYGHRLTLSGKLQTPPENEDFSYRDYLALSGIYSFLPFADASLLADDQGNPIKAAIYVLKAKALYTVYQLYPDPEASLLAGILLGVETGIPPDLDQAFRDTGTAHIIAISGFITSIRIDLMIPGKQKVFSET